MNVVTANLIIYQIGKRLFDGNRKKADLMLVFVCVLQLFCGMIYSSGTFFFTRSYEGKAILANIAIPAVLDVCRLVSAGEKQQECLDHIVCHSGQCADIFRFCYHLSYRDRSGNGSGGSYE